MTTIFNYETIEEAKAAIYSVVSTEEWKSVICCDKSGNPIQYTLDEKTACQMAVSFPIGVFESQESCDELLRKFILNNIDQIAKFVIGRGPLRSITMEYEGVVGKIIEYDEKAGYKRSESYRLTLWICRNRNSVTGFYVSDFSPVK